MEMSIDDLSLAKDVGKILQTFGKGVSQAVERAADQVAKQAIIKLKNTSPVGAGTWGGHYARKWKVKIVSGKRVIYNEKYQLTHLLENGHDVISNGKAVGHVSGQPHIKPVEEWVQDEFEELLTREIEGGIGS